MRLSAWAGWNQKGPVKGRKEGQRQRGAEMMGAHGQGR